MTNGQASAQGIDMASESGSWAFRQKVDITIMRLEALRIYNELILRKLQLIRSNKNKDVTEEALEEFNRYITYAIKAKDEFNSAINEATMLDVLK